MLAKGLPKLRHHGWDAVALRWPKIPVYTKKFAWQTRFIDVCNITQFKWQDSQPIKPARPAVDELACQAPDEHSASACRDSSPSQLDECLQHQTFLITRATHQTFIKHTSNIYSAHIKHSFKTARYVLNVLSDISDLCNLERRPKNCTMFLCANNFCRILTTFKIILLSNQKKICSNTVTKDTTTPQVHIYMNQVDECLTSARKALVEHF